eukprot:COSAG02_NODE_59_length_43585_cov_39.087752_16_plen_163_part_00
MHRCGFRLTRFDGGARLSHVVLCASVALSPSVCAAGRSGMHAAAGWAETQNQVEELNLETLTVLPAVAGPVPPNSENGDRHVAFRPPVDPTLHSSLAATFSTVGLIAGARFLLRLWREPDPRDQELEKLCDRLPTLLCLSFVASVALGLGSFFVLLAAGVNV